MSETHDPWKDVEAELARCREIAAEWGVSPDSVQLSLTPDSLVRLLAARAAEATQHQQEIAAKDAIIKQQAADLKVGGEMQDRETALKALHDEIDWMLGGVGTPDSLSLSASILMRWRGVLASPLSAPPQEPTGASPQAETREDMGDGWYVTVGRWAESIVTIEQRSLSGKADLTDDDAALIRGAAKHLQAFIGQPVEPTPEPETCEWRREVGNEYFPLNHDDASGQNIEDLQVFAGCPYCLKPLRLSQEPR